MLRELYGGGLFLIRLTILDLAGGYINDELPELDRIARTLEAFRTHARNMACLLTTANLASERITKAVTFKLAHYRIQTIVTEEGPDDVVGHKTFATGPFTCRHEPLTRKEAERVKRAIIEAIPEVGAKMMDDHYFISQARNDLADALKVLLKPDIMTEADFRESRNHAMGAIRQLNALLRIKD